MSNNLNSVLKMIQKIGNILFHDYNANHHHQILISIYQNDHKILVQQTIPKSSKLNSLLGLAPNKIINHSSKYQQIDNLGNSFDYLTGLYNTALKHDYETVFDEYFKYQNEINDLQPLLYRDFANINQILNDDNYKLEYYYPNELQPLGELSLQNYTKTLGWLPILNIDSLGNTKLDKQSVIKNLYHKFAIKQLLQNKIEVLKKRKSNLYWLS